MNFVISGAVASFVMCNNSIRIILLNYCHYYYYYHHHHRHYVLTFMHGIYCCIPETVHFSRVYSIAAVLYLQFVVHVTLFHPWTTSK